MAGVCAAFIAVVLFFLGLLAASPALHAALHHGDTHQLPVTSDDSGCVILLYAHGVTTPPPALLLPVRVRDYAREVVPCPADPLPLSPDNLRPLGRGPPVVC